MTVVTEMLEEASQHVQLVVDRLRAHRPLGEGGAPVGDMRRSDGAGGSAGAVRREQVKRESAKRRLRGHDASRSQAA